MASVKKHLPILQLVKDAKPKLRKSIINHSDLDFINTIDECILNTLKGNVPLTGNEKEKIKRFKSVLRKICNTKGGLNKKRKAISQSGGAFLPVLLTPIVEAANHSIQKK